jgi:hypothetical protein
VIGSHIAGSRFTSQQPAASGASRAAWHMSPMQVVSSFSSDTMRAFRDRRITPATRVHTDALRCCNAFADPARAITRHVTVTRGKRPATRAKCPAPERNAFPTL